MEFKNGWLMLVATIGTFILLVLLIFNPLPEKNAQIFLAISTFVLGFYFGSSVGKSPVVPAIVAPIQPLQLPPNPDDVASLAAFQAALQAAAAMKSL
jgi:hypothetical protein